MGSDRDWGLFACELLDQVCMCACIDLSTQHLLGARDVTVWRVSAVSR
jgi:hypothetical protein